MRSSRAIDVVEEKGSVGWERCANDPHGDFHVGPHRGSSILIGFINGSSEFDNETDASNGESGGTIDELAIESAGVCELRR